MRLKHDGRDSLMAVISQSVATPPVCEVSDEHPVLDPVLSDQKHLGFPGRVSGATCVVMDGPAAHRGHGGGPNGPTPHTMGPRLLLSQTLPHKHLVWSPVPPDKCIMGFYYTEDKKLRVYCCGVPG